MLLRGRGAPKGAPSTLQGVSGLSPAFRPLGSCRSRQSPAAGGVAGGICAAWLITEFNLQPSLHATVPVTSAGAAFMCK